ncbi:MAG TPA: hypothetical protein VJZ76_02280 [Thermoanaerobaculia bacterium]|nr:hypothetical protein [Thermoanaerobaculia bacterium]
MRRLLFLVFAAASRLFASEIPVAPPTITHASYFNALAAASDGVDALVAWTATGIVRCAIVRTGSAGGFAALLTVDASRLPVVRISTDGRLTAQAELQIDPNSTVKSVSIASGGDGGPLIVWDDAKSWRTLGFLTNFSFRRVPAQIDFDAVAYGPTRAVWDGSLYLVVAQGYRELAVMRVGIDAQPKGNGWLREGTVLKVAAGYLVVAGTFLDPLTASVHPDLFAPPAAIWNFTVVEDQGVPSIATDGRSILTGWSVMTGRRHALLSNGTRRPLQDLTAWDLVFDGKEFVRLNPCGCGADEVSAQFISTNGEVTADVEIDDSSALMWTGSLFFAFPATNGRGSASAARADQVKRSMPRQSSSSRRVIALSARRRRTAVTPTS